MSVTKITTHVEDAKARLLEQYKDTENIKKLVDIYSGQFQLSEDSGHDLFLNRTFEDAVGDQLDGIGEIVGEERLGRSDAKYRVALTARIATNNSEGTPEELIAIAALLTNGTRIHYIDFLGGKAGVVALETDGDVDADLTTEVLSGIQDAAAAGVRVDYVTKSVGTGAFRFAGPSVSGTESGFGVGKFAGLVEQA